MTSDLSAARHNTTASPVTVSTSTVTDNVGEDFVPTHTTKARKPGSELDPPIPRRYFAPMTTSAHAVTAALHLRRTGLSASKTQSLLYFCQGHHLAEIGEPLFAEPIWAVANGVTIDTLPDQDTDDPLAGEQLNTVGFVLARYGNLTVADLRTLIWHADPWKLAATRPDDPRIEWVWLQDWFQRAAIDSDEPRLTREQMAGLAEKALNTPPGPGTPDTRERIQGRLDEAWRRADSAP